MAAASLGRLTLDLAVKLSSFEQGMTQAERKTKQATDNINKAVGGFKSQIADAFDGTRIGSLVDGFNSKLGALNGSLATVTATAAGMAVGGVGLAVGALTALSVETAKADAQMAMLANRANIGVQSFQVLSYAAQQLGVSQEQVGSIFADVQEKLGEFSATGAGGAVDFFDALRNNTKLTDAEIKNFSKTLQGKDGVEAIQLLKDKLDDVGASSQEQRFVFESLASDLGNLLPLFANGGVLLGEYGEALYDAGVIKSEEAIKQSQVLAAQTQAVSLQFQGAKTQLVAGFMPALVDVANAMFGASENGIQLKEVGAGIGTVLKSVTKVALGFASVMSIAGKVIGGVAAAISAVKGEKMNTLNIMFDDVSATIDDYGTRISSLSSTNDEASKSSSKLVNGILALNTVASQGKGIAVSTKEAEANAKAQEKATRETAKNAKAQENLNRTLKASELSSLNLKLKSGEAIAGGGVKAYTAQFAKMTQDTLGSQLKYFSALNDGYHQDKGGRHPAGQAFDFTVKDASEANKSIARIKAMADKYGFVIKTLNEYSDPSKHATGGHIHVSVLGYKGTSETLKEAETLVKISADSTAKIEEAKRAVIEQYMTDTEKSEREHQARLSAIQYAFAGDKASIQKYTDIQNKAREKELAEYQSMQSVKSISQQKDLLEVQRTWMSAGDYATQYYELVRQEILATAEYSPEMKDALIKQANIQEGIEKNAERDQVDADYKARFGVEKSPYQQDMDFLAEARAQMLITEEEYQNARLELQAKSTASYMDGMLGGFASLVDENSKTYAVLFAAQKAFAVAQAMLNIPAAYSKAYDAVVGTPYIGPYIAPAVGAAAAALQVAQAASIKSVGLTGMAHDGIDNIPKEGTWLLDGGERVLSPNQNKDLTNFISNQGASSGANIVINNNANTKVTAKQGGDGKVYVTVDELDSMVATALSRPNSKTSKSMQQNTNAGRRR